MSNTEQIRALIAESNKIEGIIRDPTEAEIAEFERFMELDEITVEELETFVLIYQPDAKLRSKVGMDVRIGRSYPPYGGPDIVNSLEALLQSIGYVVPYLTHQRYEHLHPFTDCNGRSGRMIWHWQMREAPLGFLHKFYYQALANGR